jgi:hypothetical protein
MSQAIIPDEVFGTLRFDERVRTYDATTQLAPGHSITVTIDSMGVALGEALRKAREIYSTVVRREQEYRRAAASRLLDLYNGSWRDGEALDLASFTRRLSVSSISITPLETAATLYYADGGLFAGHFIEVFLDIDFSFANAQLAG